MIAPLKFDLLQTLRPCIIDINQDSETKEHFELWLESFRNFNERLQSHDTDAVKRGWQRYYFRGTAPHLEINGSPAVSHHLQKLSLREFESMGKEAT